MAIRRDASLLLFSAPAVWHALKVCREIARIPRDVDMLLGEVVNSMMGDEDFPNLTFLTPTAGDALHALYRAGILDFDRDGWTYTLVGKLHMFSLKDV